ncbi:hypothetical protein [Botrimarina hoheduenensis]|uniref:hypothetical protein n=1 Tax=Botrimarina hoheduenensis TaxID=2528000 RepID=UPI001E372617|nr:hypothetical protein [Botrimarina hoheduenensis]
MADVFLGIQPFHPLQRVVRQPLGDHPVAKAVDCLDVVVVGTEADLLAHETLLQRFIDRIDLDIVDRLHPGVADNPPHSRHHELDVLGGGFLKAPLKSG